MDSHVDLPTRATLVIGYGNELRGDDGAGPAVADLVARWTDPSITVIRCLQLTPELAEPVARAGQVVFVDAAPGSFSAEPRVAVLRLAAEAVGGVAHTCTPQTILAIARELYGNSPPAWLVTVSAAGFETGAPLSAQCQAGVQSALRQIRRIVMPGAPTPGSEPWCPRH